jgi:hypothetical protein
MAAAAAIGRQPALLSSPGSALRQPGEGRVAREPGWLQPYAPPSPGSTAMSDPLEPRLPETDSTRGAAPETTTTSIPPLGGGADPDHEDTKAGPGGAGPTRAPAERPTERPQPPGGRLLDRFRIASPDRHLKQLWPHPLELMDPAVVYKECNGGWKCNGCGTLHGAIMYHCTTTGAFDLCQSCVRGGRGYVRSSEVDGEELPRLPSRGAPPNLGRTARPSARDWMSTVTHDGGGGPARDARVVAREEFWQKFRHARMDEVLEVSRATRMQSLAAADEDAGVRQPELDEVTERLTLLYRSIDTDFSDSLSARELWEGLSSIGLGLSMENTRRMVAMADTDGDGNLDLQEFLSVFRSCFLDTGALAQPSNASEWRDDTLVRLHWPLSALTGRVIMARQEVTDAVWKYIESEGLQEGSGPNGTVELSPLLLPLFQVNALASQADDAGAGAAKKKKGKKKDSGAGPTISNWQLKSIMDSRIRQSVSPIFRSGSSPADDAFDEESADENTVESLPELHTPRNVDDFLSLDMLATPKQAAPMGTPVSTQGSASAVTPRSAFLASTALQGLLPLPLPLAITQSCDADGIHGTGRVALKIQRQSMGRGYCTALSASLMHFDASSVVAFDAVDCGMDDSQGADLVRGLAQQVQLATLDLQGNRFGRGTAKVLEKLLVPNQMKVSKLWLSR